MVVVIPIEWLRADWTIDRFLSLEEKDTVRIDGQANGPLSTMCPVYRMLVRST